MAEVTLELLFFADVARKTGNRQETICLPGDSTLADLQDEVFRRHPQLKPMERHLVWSVDEEVATPKTRLGTASRVGVMPPFSGG